MLFRGTLAATAITRALTFSEFDHVGIVIRLEGHESVYIMEATGNSGVRLAAWNDISKHVG